MWTANVPSLPFPDDGNPTVDPKMEFHPPIKPGVGNVSGFPCSVRHSQAKKNLNDHPVGLSWQKTTPFPIIFRFLNNPIEAKYSASSNPRIPPM